MNRGPTISQVAAFAGVTVKTVRHYHRLKLVAEPPRDRSGYRRYSTADLLRLVQVRTLAEAGVPLAEIAGVLDADPKVFATNVAAVEQRLTERIEQLIARRAMLQRLTTGNRLLLPERALALLDRAAKLGLPAAYLATIPSSLALAKALVSDFDAYLDLVERTLDDATSITLLKRWWKAKDWAPHDPRVDALAAAAAKHLLSQRHQVTVATGLLPKRNAGARSDLLEDYRAAVAPSWVRLSALVDEKLRAAGIATPGRR